MAGRPATWEKEEVLRKAMYLFWRRGYHAVSVEDVLQETGINRFALYEKFGSKDDLFSAALDHYEATILTPLYGPLLNHPKGVGALLEALNKLRAANLNEAYPPGCMVVNVLLELRMAHPEFESRAIMRCKTHQDGLLQTLRKARAKGEITLGADLPEHVAHVMAMLKSFHSIAKISRAMADEIIASLLAEVESWQTTAVPSAASAV